MSDFPQSSSGQVVTPLFVNSFDMQSPMYRARTSNGIGALTVGTATTWVANLAIYIPMFFPWDYPVNRVFWCNGATVASSAASFAIYDSGGTQIYTTGSVALSGASAPQYTTPSTPFVLKAGEYYFGYSCNNTTSRVLGTTTLTAAAQRSAGIYQEASAHPLPATPTFAAASSAVYPTCGVTRTTSGF